MILGIVGAEAAKFTALGEARARDVIVDLIHCYGATGVASGHCHLGGIDIWAEEVAQDYGIYSPELIFLPATHSWESGYKPRNIQIVEASNIVICIAVLQLPVDFKGMVFDHCYHCLRHKETISHVKSGGCWTRWYAESIGKCGELIVVSNV